MNMGGLLINLQFAARFYLAIEWVPYQFQALVQTKLYLSQ